MASTTTRNLKLILDPTLTASARSNLEKIDLLGSTFLTDSSNSLRIRSSSDISIEPESPDLGGSAMGGTLSIGNASQFLTTVQVNTSLLQITSGLSILDQSVVPASAKYLTIEYLSSLQDTTAGRTLFLDPVGANRTLRLGGSLVTTGGDLTLIMTGATSVTLPVTGTLSTLAGIETLTNKSIDATQNTIRNLSNTSISASAGISYSKLDLTGDILDSDVATGAEIAYSKLALSGSILRTDLVPSLGLTYSYLDLTGSILLTDLSSSIVIPGSYISPTFVSSISTLGTLTLQGPTYGTTLELPSGIEVQTQNLTLVLPGTIGTPGQVLSTDGVGNLSWVDKTTGGQSITGKAFDWVNSDGSTKTIVHNLATIDVDVLVNDVDRNKRIWIDNISIVDINTVVVSSSIAPPGTWRVIIQGQ